MAHNPISLKIKEDYGTVKRFCEKNNINYSTWKVVMAGNGKSARIINILKKHKYIKDEKELEKRLHNGNHIKK